MTQVSTLALPLGSVLAIGCSGYRHLVIAGPLGPDGKPSLISATSRLGTVMEERWDDVVQGREVRLVSTPEFWIDGAEAVARARKYIGVWKYNLLIRNCEHFVSEVIEGNRNSPQLLKAGLITVGVVALGIATSRLRQA